METNFQEISFSNQIEMSLFENRTVFLCGEINQNVAKEVCSKLIALDFINSNPIRMLINSQGGHVESGDTIHDVIRFIKSPVITVGTGFVASAGALIYLATDKQRRFSLPNTRFMIHQPSGGSAGTATEIGIQAEEIIKMKERIDKIIANATGQSLERVASDSDRDHWMTAEEAIDYGMVYRVIDSISDIDSNLL